MQFPEFEERTDGRSQMAIMDRTGDTKVTWDPKNDDEVGQARKTFTDLKAKGFLAFKVVAKDGSKGEQIREFDPNAAMIILSPPLVGG